MDFKQLVPKIKKLGKIIHEMTDNIHNISQYISRSDFLKIKELDPEELGIMGFGKIRSSAYEIIDQLIDKAKVILLQMKKDNLLN
jgi:hypothetical protein